MIWSADPSPCHIASKTSLAILPEMVASAIRLSSLPSACAETGLRGISSPSRFSAAASSPFCQLAQSLGSAPDSPTSTSK